MNIKLKNQHGISIALKLKQISALLFVILFVLFTEAAVSGNVSGPKQKYSDYCRSINRQLGKCIQLQSCPKFFDWIRQRPIVKANVKTVVQFTCYFDSINPKVCCPLGDIDATGNSILIQDNAGFGDEPASPTSPAPSLPEPQKLIASTSKSISSSTTHAPLVFPDNSKDSNLLRRRVNKLNKNAKFQLLPALKDCSASVKLNRLIGAYGSHPWIALIGNKDSGKFEHSCTGTIINNRYILTAAQCRFAGTRLTHIRVGDYNLETERDEGSIYLPASTYKEYRIERIISHEDFDKQTKSNDIALIRVDTPIDFNSIFIKPVCLPFVKEYGISDLLKLDQLNNFISRKVLVSGWGKTTSNSIGSQILQEAPVHFTSYEECENAFEGNVPRPLREYFCVGGHQRENSCTVDSGGPLTSPVRIDINRVGPKIFQLGIFSHGPTGEQCSKYQPIEIDIGIRSRQEPRGLPINLIPLPSVYTNVFSYLDWILNSIQP